MKINRCDSAIFVEGPKRNYAPYTLHDDCEICGSESTIDLNDQYLSNPNLNGGIEKVYFACGNCDHDWIRKIKVDLVLTEVKK